MDDFLYEFTYACAVARNKHAFTILTKFAKKSNMSDENSQNSCTILQQLFHVIEQRKREMPPDSYTTTLFQAGIGKITAKINEESQELIDAATVTAHTTGQSDNTTNPPHILMSTKEKSHVVYEAADLVYHLFVLLAACDLSLTDVERELARRFGVSGLVERANRKT